MPTLHLVPHTHWDREWYLPFQSFRIKLVHLIDLLLDILDGDPDFKYFTLDGQTILLEDYLQVRPEREADLIRHIRSGRLSIGPWYILPDEFLVSPEATVRNLLIGKTICARFGKRMDLGYLPDPFGHIGQMPQILRGFGIETAIFRRGLSDEPCELWWQAPDGSRILAIYLRDGYDNAAPLPTDIDAFTSFILDRRDSLAPHSAVSHLLLLNGTDHHEPQPEASSLVAEASLEGDTLIFSDLPNFVNAVRQDIQARSLTLPITQGELRDPRRHHLLPGVLSSRVWIKQRNHRCEILLERWAEPFSAWAEMVTVEAPHGIVWTGQLTTPRVARPSALVKEAWRLLLQCHPHDSICGCSLDQVHEEMRSRFDQVEQIGEEITCQNLAALAESVDTASLAVVGAQSALVVFNPHPSARTDLAAGWIEIPSGLDPFAIVDDKGNLISYQVVEKHSRSLADMDLDVEGLQSMMSILKVGRVMGLSVQEVAIVQHPDYALIDLIVAENAEPNMEAVESARQQVESLLVEDQASKFRLIARFATKTCINFVASEVPGHGYRVYGLQPAARYSSQPMEDESRIIENDILRLEITREGEFTLTDLRSGTVYPDIIRFHDQADRGDSYTFCPVANDRPIDSTNPPRSVRRTINAGIQTLEISTNLILPVSLNEDRSTRSDVELELPIQIQARILPELARVDLEINLENRAEDHRLKVLFPLNLRTSEAHYDGHFEVVRRATSIPQGSPDWSEQPVAEQPMRNFVASGREGSGLMIATRGLREASVSADGVMAITLLRSFGWLSRADLATRKGGAGPQIPTPNGQALGAHSFNLSLIPYQDDLIAAQALAEAIQSSLRVASTPLHTGTLPASGSFLSIEPPTFALTAVKIAEDDNGLIVRGINLSHEEIEVQIRCLFPLQSAFKARIDETPLERLQVEADHQVWMKADPHEILTTLLHLVPH